jgi:hypothetical protein
VLDYRFGSDGFVHRKDGDACVRRLRPSNNEQSLRVDLGGMSVGLHDPVEVCGSRLRAIRPYLCLELAERLPEE